MADSDFRFTIDLLQQYCAAALQNGNELLEEASLLLSNGHAARAYFLAVASIEEIGKAVQAFDAQGRNLGDSAVTAKLLRAMGDHSAKITAAFIPVLLMRPNPHDTLMPVVKLMIHLKGGREPSMYTDIRYEESKVKAPTAVIGNVAAHECVQFARYCLTHARKHIAKEKPRTRSRAEDELFAMKLDQLQKMMNTEGFWWYYITQLKAGNQEVAAIVVAYKKKYFSKDKAFERPDDEEK